jgi:hypothetical protein
MAEVIMGDGLTLKRDSAATSIAGVALVSNGGFFIMNGGTIDGKDANGNNITVHVNGGGVVVGSGGSFIMIGGTVSGNTVAFNGGGVYVDGSGGSFTMSGGTVSGNTANLSGGGVYVVGSGSSFTMSGDATVAVSNPVYLGTGSVITLSGALTVNPAANIQYPTGAGTQVLGDDSSTTENDITLADNYTKFLLNGEAGRIGSDGKITGP